MRTVRDPSGAHLLLLKESDASSLVRNPETGEERHVPNEDLEPVDGEAPLATVAAGVPDPIRTLVAAVPNERALGLLLHLDAEGPISVRRLLATTDLCESDLHGLLAECTAADLLTETRVGGERGYDTTETANEGLAMLRD